MKKCLIYMAIGASLALTYKMYEKELICMCNKMIKKGHKSIEDGLEIE